MELKCIEELTLVAIVLVFAMVKDAVFLTLVP